MLTSATRSSESSGLSPTFGSAPPGPWTLVSPPADAAGPSTTAWSESRNSLPVAPA